MSDRNEKFFSESKIKDEPKKKLSLKLGDGVVTTDKIHDGAVTEDKLASQSVTADKLNDDIYKVMQSVEAGAIALEQGFGNHENLGISQKFLSETIGGINDALGEDDDKGTVRGRLTDLEDAIGDDGTAGTIKERLTTVEETVEDGGPLDRRIRHNTSIIGEETEERTYADENLLALINAGIRDGEGLEFDIEPTRASANPVTSGGIWTAIERLPRLTNSENTDLNISDENGNVIMEMQGGQVRTKEFDSRDVYNFSEGNTKADFTVEDPDGNILAEFNMGHIRTRDFDSRELSNIKVDSSKVDFSIKDNSGNSIVEFYNGHIRTQCFDSADSRTITILDNILFIN